MNKKQVQKIILESLNDPLPPLERRLYNHITTLIKTSHLEGSPKSGRMQSTIDYIRDSDLDYEYPQRIAMMHGFAQSAFRDVYNKQDPFHNEVDAYLKTRKDPFMNWHSHLMDATMDGRHLARKT